MDANEGLIAVLKEVKAVNDTVSALIMHTANSFRETLALVGEETATGRRRDTELLVRIRQIEDTLQKLKPLLDEVLEINSDYREGLHNHSQRLLELERTVAEYAVDRGRIAALEVRANEEGE